jgi:hypothetical protein
MEDGRTWRTDQLLGELEDGRSRLDRANPLAHDDRPQERAPSRHVRVVVDRCREWPIGKDGHRTRERQPLQHRADCRRRRDSVDERGAVRVDQPRDLVRRRRRGRDRVVPTLLVGWRGRSAQASKHPRRAPRDVDLAELRNVFPELPFPFLGPDRQERVALKGSESS